MAAFIIGFLAVSQLYPLIIQTMAQVQYPTVNCPNIFQYSYDPNNGGYYGLVTIQRDGSSTSELQVNMTINTQTSLTSNIKIKILTRQNDIFNGNVIKYAVLFPTQNILPKLTQLQFNGRVLCSGEPDPFGPGVIQTSMWAKSTVTTFSGLGPTRPTTTEMPYFPGNPFLTTTQRTVITPTRSTTTTTTPTITTTRRPITTTATTTTTTTTTQRPRRVNECGTTKAVTNLIIEGEGIKPGEFPWLVAIMHKQQLTYKLRCTGSLVSDRHVLTAGQCVRYHNAPLSPNEDFLVILGKLNMDNWASGSTIKNALRIVAHPKYKQNAADYDLAIIVLKEAVQYRPAIRAICLWEGADSLDSIVGVSGTVVGWPRLIEGDEKDDTSTLARKVEMPVVSPENCLRSNKVFKNYVTERTFCAGDRTSSSGPCAGDSGAGFMMQENGKWFLRGMVSYAIRDSQTLTCDLTNYVVFTDVAKLRDWVREEMRKDVDD